MARETAEVNANALLGETTENFQIEQRPWLYFSASVTNEVVKWEDAKKWGIPLHIRVDVVNIGKTPATDVFISPISPEVAYPIDPDVGLRDEACAKAIAGPVVDGSDIFPGGKATFFIDAWLPGSRIRPRFGQTGLIMVALATCVRYRPTYSASIPYLFGQAFNLGVIDPSMPNDIFHDIPITRDIDANELHLFPSRVAGRTIK